MPQVNIQKQNLTLQNPQAKGQNPKQQSNQNPKEAQLQQNPTQKKQQDNDCLCEFKLTVREKYKEKLKHDQTQDMFTIVINEIIEERIKRNFVAVEEVQQQIVEVKDVEEEKQLEQKKTHKGPSEIDKLKAEDEQVKRKIKELMRKKPKRRQLKYELDPNRDKGFILAKKMNEIKQQRQQKYLQSRKQQQQQQTQLFKNQLTTIDAIQNFSLHLAQRRSRLYTSRKNSDQYKLPKISQNNFFQPQTMRNSKNGFHDFLTQSKVLSQRDLIESTPQKPAKYRCESLTLSGRLGRSKDKKRDLDRELEILRKSKKITQHYQVKKMVHEILDLIIFNSVRLVQTKKEFFFNAPPKPVHEMIRNYKDKNGKTVWIPGSKPQKFRINVQLTNKKEKIQINLKGRDQSKQFQQNSSRISQVNQTIDICIRHRSDDKDQPQIDEQSQNSANNQSNENDQHQSQQDQILQQSKQIQNNQTQSQQNQTDQQNNQNFINQQQTHTENDDNINQKALQAQMSA